MLKTKQKKERKKKSCSCQLCGRVTSEKHLHTTEPHHPGPTCAHTQHRFEVSELKIPTFCCSAPAMCFAQSQSDVNLCLYLEERRFFVVIQTTSKHWAQWSLYLPCSLGGDEAGCVYCECVHSEAPGPFISFFIEVDVVS